MKSLLQNNSKLYYCFLHIIFFFYVYSIQFSSIPFGIGTRVILAILGFSHLFLLILKQKMFFSYDKKFNTLFILLFGISLVSLASILINRTKDFEFVKYPISILLIFFAGYFISLLLKKTVSAENRAELISKIIVNVVFIQVVLSLVIFLNPPFREVLNSIQIASDVDESMLTSTEEFRLVGFGSKFFGAGAVNGFALLLIAGLIKTDKNIKSKIFLYSFMFLIIFALGMMMARTTIIGFFMALGILFFPSNGFTIPNKKKSLLFLSYLIAIPILIVVVLFSFFPAVIDEFEPIFNFGFEMFVKYFESGALETKSTDQLAEMVIYPDRLHTYIIGDGLYADPTYEGKYYMGTDIGFLRLIFYFGLIGVFVFMFTQYYVIKMAYNQNSKFKILFIFSFLYLIILNLKGFYDLIYLMILFGFVINDKVEETCEN